MDATASKTLVMIDKVGNLMNYWNNDSPHTPWWTSELSKDPDDKKIWWVNVGFVNPLMAESKDKITRVLAISGHIYSRKFN